MSTGRAIIIFLNGVSSLGKTSMAKLLQAQLPDPYLHVCIDSFEEMLPDRYEDGEEFAWPVLFPRMLSGFHHSIAAMAAAGSNLIVDHITVFREGWPSSLLECAYLLMPFRAYLVGVHCPLDELERREQTREGRVSGTAARQFARVHRHAVYDLEVDTSLASPEECAQQITTLIASAEPAAFAQIRAQSSATLGQSTGVQE